ncbi:MAG TPA: DNA repair protein RadA, partial [Dehalococcoidia bacterium]|nr:DNA repair protein RadA [Dehalococcoidia bacterium]
MVSSAKQARTVFRCTECGYEAPKWMGRCPECMSWNSFSERSKTSDGTKGQRVVASNGTQPIEMAALADEDEARTPLGVNELDRVLGGGVVAGSLVLIGGDPGIGKS